MKVLAIDLGETTGYCLLGNAGEILSHGTSPLGIAIRTSIQPDLVVVERPGFVGAGARIQEQYSDAVSGYRNLYPNVKVVRPADWMPRFGRHPLPERGVLPTQHEKDAYRMAHWARQKFSSDDSKRD